MHFPTFGKIFRNETADAAKIAMDNAGGWDRITAALYRWHLIPRSRLGKTALIGGLSAAGAVLQENVAGETVLSKILQEVGSDAPSEIGGRILAQQEPAGTDIVDAVIISPAPEKPGGTIAAMTDWFNGTFQPKKE